MGKKNKKQFIDKKSAHKFTLVHRSQRDPLQADDEVGEHVLMPLDQAGGSSEKEEKEEKVKFGITYDDDYDYMQHLRPRGEGMLILADNPSKQSEIVVQDEDKEDLSFGNLKLPSDAFASTQEEDIGMLNKGVLPRGPQPDWDPDIVQALDEDIDFDDPDNFLDDDFMLKANAEGGMMEGECDLSEGLFSERKTRYPDAANEDEWETESENGSYISSDNLMSDDEDPFSNEETKSRFTNYSMTSSVIRRTEGLKVLDDRFERIMEEYDEEGIGCVDQEEVQGVFDVNNDLVNHVIDDFYESNKKHDLSKIKDGENDENLMDGGGEETDEEEEEEKIFEQFMSKPKEKWDCESIISTYSNIYNHPKLITEESIKKYELHKHTGIPIGVFAESVKKGVDEDSDSEMTETVTLNNVRNKDETPEERKQRKKDVKDQRKNRRVEKKSNKIAFKNEEKKQEKVKSNTIAQRGNIKL